MQSSQSPGRGRPGQRPAGLRRRSGRAPVAQVHGITTARRKQRDDVHDRMVKYSVSMGVRLVCLVLAFVVEGWLAWVFVAGAVLLPYVAVLLANAGRETAPRTPAAHVGTGLGAAAPGRTTGHRPALAPASAPQAGPVPPGTWQHAYRQPHSSAQLPPAPVRRARAS